MIAARNLLAQALHLDDDARATLALELMDSPSAPERRDEASWIETIERRARRALSGEEPGVDADEALDRIARGLGLSGRARVSGACDQPLDEALHRPRLS